MSEPEKSTVSVANTPVRRAVTRSSKTLLLALFILGIAAGWVYNRYWRNTPAPAPAPSAGTRQP